jgi:septal ring factor EnvC (AmiA/AmiB activator)
MMKKTVLVRRHAIIPLLLAFFVSISSVSYSQNAKEDLEKKRDELVKEIETLQKELNQTKSSKKNNLTQLTALQKKIKAREKLIGSYNGEISQFNKEITNKSRVIRALDNDLDTLRMNYANMVYYAYKHRSAYDRLLFLFSADDFNDAFQRLKYIKRYNAYRRQQAELIQTTQADLKKQMGSLRIKKQGRQKLVNEQVEQKKKLTVEKKEKDKIAKTLTAQEKTLKASIDKKKKEQEKLKAEIASLIKKEIEEAKKKAAASGTTASAKSSSSSLALTPEAAALSSGFASNQGKLPWPVTKGEIKEQFGTHAHDVFDNLTVKNNGVDIKTSPGAEVRAIFKGTVVSILSNPGYHKAVLVRHGEYFTVYSNLASVKVKANQEIDTKQSLGVAYTEPGSGESIIHLEIWKGTTLLNPESWIAGR